MESHWGSIYDWSSILLTVVAVRKEVQWAALQSVVLRRLAEVLCVDDYKSYAKILELCCKDHRFIVVKDIINTWEARLGIPIVDLEVTYPQFWQILAASYALIDCHEKAVVALRNAFMFDNSIDASVLIIGSSSFCSLHRFNSAQSLLEKAINTLNDEEDPKKIKQNTLHVLPLVDYCRGSWAVERRVSLSRPVVEVVAFTNVTRKLVHNSHLSAPGSGLIQQTLSTFQQYVQKDYPTKVKIYLDRAETDLDARYYSSLETMARLNDFDLVVNPRIGLRRQWLRAINEFTSEFVVILEHDWEFLSHAFSLESAIKILSDRPDLNILRFNKRRNKIFKTDRYFVPEKLLAPPGIIRSPSYSNNPHVLRVSFARKYLSILLKSADFDFTNSGAGGIESFVYAEYAAVARSIGETAALRLFGFAILGSNGAARQVRHLGV